MTRRAPGGAARRARRAPLVRPLFPAAALALLLLGAGTALAQPREIAATVVWTEGDRAYVVMRDSTALATGMLVTLEDHHRVLAAGTVASLAGGSLAVVRLTSGSLARVKKPQRLRVLVEPPEIGREAMLRVGVPEGARANLVVACGDESPEPALVSLGYRVEMPDAAEWRGVRVARPATDAPWPDTLIVRAYRLAADEEIALERGEIDVAVFWPGERSSRLRADPRWSDAPRGLRARGVIAALEPVATTAEDTAGMARLAGAIRADGPLAALNPQLFGDDLVPWARLDSAAAPGPARAAGSEGAAVTVDDALPGRSVIQRFLDRGLSAAYAGRARAVHLTRLDLPLAARDSLRSEWRARGVVPLYGVGCPVVCAPGRGAYVRRLGADAFADLAACGPGPRRP